MNKKIQSSFILVVLFIVLITFGGCESLDLDMTTDPNRIAVKDANPRSLLNNVSNKYIDFIERMGNASSRITRIYPMIGTDLDNGLYSEIYVNDKIVFLSSGDDLNNAWQAFYSESLPELDLLEDIASEDTEGLYLFHVAISKIMKSHMASVLVDYYGDIIFSQANNILDYPQPMLDDQKQVYSNCIQLLDQAIALLEQNPFSANLDDRFYNGDSDKWLLLANSLKLRMYKNTSNQEAFNDIITSGKFITNAADDFIDPIISGSFSLKMLNDYNGGGVDHKSNWLMRKMLDSNDPRIRYYFYRQTGDIETDPTILECLDDEIPSHYSGFDYCTVDNGYHGRSHGSVNYNDPQDNGIMALYGVYPYAGRFDDDRFEIVNTIETGGHGEGITPILLASDIDFWRAQMSSQESEISSFLRAGMEKSITKVMIMGSVDRDANLAFEPTDVEIGSFIDSVVIAFESAADPEIQNNIIAEQYFISMFGNGIEAYNYYRKTGFPTSLAPSWNANPGPFPRSFLYPKSEIESNSNIQTVEKLLTDQVFWDTNPTFPSFPPSN